MHRDPGDVKTSTDERGYVTTSFEIFQVLSCYEVAHGIDLSYACDVIGDLTSQDAARSLAAAISTTAPNVYMSGPSFDVEGKTDMTHLPMCTFNRLICSIDEVVGGVPERDSCYLQNGDTVQCV